MKILYIIDSHPENGGAPISTCSIATEISKIYDDTFLILPAQDKPYSIIDKVRTIEIKELKNKFPLFINQPIKAITLVRVLRREITKLKPDIIHIHMPRAAWAVGLLKLLKAIPSNTKLIYTDRDQVETYRWPLRLLSLLLINLTYNHVVSLTNIGSFYWRNRIGKANVSVISNSAGKIYEKYDSSMHSKIRKGIQIDEGTFTIMFSGRMSIYKNWGLAKDIVLNLKNQDIFFIFAISTMNQEQEDSFKQFSAEIKDLGVKHVIFHNVTQDDMSNYYYMSDIFILTSDRESFGRTAIEAMSRKCVVIGRDVGGLPEVIGKEENVLECDINAFTERILFYKSNIDSLNEDKDWFIKRFINNYTVNANTEKHESIYEDIVSNNCED